MKATTEKVFYAYIQETMTARRIKRTVARFNSPGSIVIDGTNLFVVDSVNEMIHKAVMVMGKVTTLAGSTTPGYVGTTSHFKFEV